MERQRLNTTMEKGLLKALKIKAIDLDTDVSKILDCLVEKYLDKVIKEDFKDK